MVLIVKKYKYNNTQSGSGVGRSKQISPDIDNLYSLYADDELHKMAGHKKKNKPRRLFKDGHQSQEKTRAQLSEERDNARFAFQRARHQRRVDRLE
jgi:hypothetical protein